MSQPDFNVKLKSKESGSVISLLGAWENERGINGQFSHDIAEIKLSNGSVLKPDEIDGKFVWPVWLNIYDNRDDEKRVQTPKDDAPF